jgi:hypothetical protein
MKTFKEILEIDQEVAKLYKANENLKDGKFGYGYKRFYAKNLTPLLEKYQEGLQDIYVANALEDEKTKALIMEKDGSSYSYSKAGKIQCLKEERTFIEEFNKKEVEIEPYIIKPENLPELTEEQEELFNGVLME